MIIKNKVTVTEVNQLIKYARRQYQGRQVVTREQIEQHRRESLTWRKLHFGY